VSAQEIAAQLASILRRQGLDDPSWIATLDEHDEPPFFTRAQDVVIAWAVEVLDRAAQFVETLPAPEHYFLCLTFSDWPLVADGTQAVATPALLVSLDASRELGPFRLRHPASSEARQVSSWLDRIDRDDLYLQEDLHDPDQLRVYVGHRAARAFETLAYVQARGR
jgi:hypothetical protein